MRNRIKAGHFFIKGPFNISGGSGSPFLAAQVQEINAFDAGKCSRYGREPVFGAPFSLPRSSVGLATGIEPAFFKAEIALASLMAHAEVTRYVSTACV
jgi:hypothetical protein